MAGTRDVVMATDRVMASADGVPVTDAAGAAAVPDEIGCGKERNRRSNTLEVFNLAVMAASIRLWKQEDLDNLVRYANNFHIWSNLRNYFPHPYTEENGKEWLAKVVDAPLPALNFAIDVEGEAVGGIGLILNSDVYVKSAEVGYWLGEPWWGKGITTEALRLITEHAFYYFDLVRLYAEVFETNKASMRVLEKNGYYLEGVRRKAVYKNDVLMDDFIWVKLRPW